jgi:hypothetical protein
MMIEAGALPSFRELNKRLSNNNFGCLSRLSRPKSATTG